MDFFIKEREMEIMRCDFLFPRFITKKHFISGRKWMYQRKEFGNGTLNQRHARDGHLGGGQVTIDFTSIPDGE